MASKKPKKSKKTSNILDFRHLQMQKKCEASNGLLRRITNKIYDTEQKYRSVIYNELYSKFEHIIKTSNTSTEIWKNIYSELNNSKELLNQKRIELYNEHKPFIDKSVDNTYSEITIRLCSTNRLISHKFIIDSYEIDLVFELNAGIAYETINELVCDTWSVKTDTADLEGFNKIENQFQLKNIKNIGLNIIKHVNVPKIKEYVILAPSDSKCLILRKKP